MIPSRRTLLRALLISISPAAFFVAGCHKNGAAAKIPPAAEASPTPTPSVKPESPSTKMGESSASPSPEAYRPSLDELFLKDVRDAYFDYDSATIRSDARAALHKSAEFLRDHPSAHVTVEGHCDERGSTEYNIALGQRRAKAVEQYIVSLGVPADQIAITSWGKERPFCAQENENCWQQNRRGHFVLLNK